MQAAGQLCGRGRLPGCMASRVSAAPPPQAVAVLSPTLPAQLAQPSLIGADECMMRRRRYSKPCTSPAWCPHGFYTRLPCHTLSDWRQGDARTEPCLDLPGCSMRGWCAELALVGPLIRSEDGGYWVDVNDVQVTGPLPHRACDCIHRSSACAHLQQGWLCRPTQASTPSL